MKQQIRMPGPKPGPAVSGASVPRVLVPQPKTTPGRPLPHPSVTPAPPARGHISPEVRGDLSKLSPELAAGIRAVADRK
jgi:hypothetical protein